MRKSLFALCALALAFAACDKTEEPQIVPELKLTTEAAVTVPQEGDIISVTFESNVNWTAELDVEKDVASLNIKNGTKEEGKVKITVMPFTDDNATRTITLSLTPENGKPVNVVLTQNGPFVPFFTVSEKSLEFGVEGGTKSFTISTNVEYTVGETKIGTVKIEGENVQYTVPATEELGSRSESIVFTVPSIKVQDKEGKEVDMTVAVVATQAGKAETVFVNTLTEEIIGETRFSTALIPDYLLIANGTQNILAFNRKTGELVTKIDAGFPVTCIANDEAGNVVVMTGGKYQETVTVYYVPAASVTDKSTYVKGFECKCTLESNCSIDNMVVNGNVFKDALITANNGLFAIGWEIRDGKYKGGEDYTDYVGVPKSEYSGKWGIMRHVGIEIDGGAYFCGYDVASIWYNPGMSKANWRELVPSGGDWTNGIVALEYLENGGHKYMAAYNYAFFNYSKSYVRLFNIDNVQEPKEIGAMPFITQSSVANYVSADMSVAIEDGKIAVYVIDDIKNAMAKFILNVL